MRNLLWKAAALTLGEAAAVTIINTTADTRQELIFATQNEFSDLCCVPLERPERFIDSDAMLRRLADGCFIANMPKMASAGYKAARDVLQRYIALHGAPDIVLPHTVSQTMPQHISKNLLPPEVLKNCFPAFGNIATCSIPVGYEYFDCASKQGLHVVGWIAAAGMSHCIFRIG